MKIKNDFKNSFEKKEANCKNCGAPLKWHCGRSVCEYCGSVYEDGNGYVVEVLPQQFKRYVCDCTVAEGAFEYYEKDEIEKVIRDKLAMQLAYSIVDDIMVCEEINPIQLERRFVGKVDVRECMR